MGGWGGGLCAHLSISWLYSLSSVRLVIFWFTCNTTTNTTPRLQPLINRHPLLDELRRPAAAWPPPPLPVAVVTSGLFLMLLARKA